MANNLKQSLYIEDEVEIDFRAIFKALIESKKLMMSTMLIFTIASIIYSLSLKPLYISSAQLEIGYVELNNGDRGTRELIESTSDLISDLKVFMMKNPDDKFKQDVTIKPFQGRVIKLETTSDSAEKNENLLTEMIKYIYERHSYLEKLITNQRNNLLSSEIESTLAEITHFKSKLSDQSQSEYLNIISNLNKEDKSVEHLKLLYRNSLYKDKVFSLNQKLSILNQELEKVNSAVGSKSQVITSIDTKTKKPKIALTIFIGLIIGFIIGIFLVSIRNFEKALKRDKHRTL